VRPGFSKMRRRHHGPKCGLDWPLRIGEKAGNTRQRFVRFGVEDVENGADQQGVAGFLPMVATFERSLGVHQDIGDILDVAHLPFAPSHFQQRIVRCRLRVGRVEQQHRPCRARKPDVRVQFSPLMSCTMQLPGHVSRVGTTRPTPLPDRVGAKHSTCSGPS
jgi:hypothetical protein